MTFRPYPGLTFACAILFAILCGLGVWQLERLQWKLALIAQVNSHMAAAPVPLETILAMPGAQAQYRKVTLTGRFDHAREAYVFTTDGGAAVYHVLTPFITRAGTLLVDRGEVPKEKLDPATRAQGNVAGEQTITGVWRARPSARSAASRSSPVMSGSRRSSVTASKLRSRQRRSASAPVAATSTA